MEKIKTKIIKRIIEGETKFFLASTPRGLVLFLGAAILKGHSQEYEYKGLLYNEEDLILKFTEEKRVLVKNMFSLNVGSYGVRIKKKRLSMGLSQAAYARKIGISCTYLSLIERGHRKPPKELLISIVDTQV